jgi:cytoskeletal protein CcmA (bactofilin family)
LPAVTRIRNEVAEKTEAEPRPKEAEIKTRPNELENEPQPKESESEPPLRPPAQPKDAEPGGDRFQSIMQPPKNKPVVPKQLELPPRQVPAIPAPVKREEIPEHKEKLVVGPRIRLKGEITNCDSIIVEGHVEASAKSRMLRVTKVGTFRGDAEVETAEINGRFEGKLTVSHHLVIRSGGRAMGAIQYSDIEIETGGQISGDVEVLSDESESEAADIDLDSWQAARASEIA